MQRPLSRNVSRILVALAALVAACDDNHHDNIDHARSEELDDDLYDDGVDGDVVLAPASNDSADSPTPACDVEGFAGTSPREEEEEEEETAILVDSIELANGNVLRFYADADGWIGVHESRDVPGNVSLLRSVNHGTSPIEIWRLAAGPAARMPDALAWPAIDLGLIAEGDARHGQGGANALVSVSDPMAASGYCDLPLNDDGFEDEFCNADFDYDGWDCDMNIPGFPNYSQIVTAAQSAIQVEGGWCSYGGSSWSIQYRTSCSPSGSWTTASNSNDAVDDFIWFGNMSTIRQYRLVRYTGPTPAAIADMGLHWETHPSCVG